MELLHNRGRHERHDKPVLPLERRIEVPGGALTQMLLIARVTRSEARIDADHAVLTRKQHLRIELETAMTTDPGSESERQAGVDKEAIRNAPVVTGRNDILQMRKIDQQTIVKLKAVRS